METKKKLLLKSLDRFYEDPKNCQKLLDITGRRVEGLSLRTIEWYVTNFAKKNNVNYAKEVTGRIFSVHIEYKSTLEGYSKKLFDPFCRTDRIDYAVGDTILKTTIGQLNFIRWCIQNDIVEHMLDEIDKYTLRKKNPANGK